MRKAGAKTRPLVLPTQWAAVTSRLRVALCTTLAVQKWLPSVALPLNSAPTRSVSGPAGAVAVVGVARSVAVSAGDGVSEAVGLGVGVGVGVGTGVGVGVGDGDGVGVFSGGSWASGAVAVDFGPAGAAADGAGVGVGVPGLVPLRSLTLPAVVAARGEAIARAVTRLTHATATSTARASETPRSIGRLTGRCCCLRRSRC